MLSLDRIYEELNDLGVCPPRIFFYPETDSTNLRAREYAKENPGESAIFIADCQSAGRGRRGRSFVSNRGAGIYISFLIYPEEKASDATQMTAKAAVALARAVEHSTRFARICLDIQSLRVYAYSHRILKGEPLSICRQYLLFYQNTRKE